MTTIKLNHLDFNGNQAMHQLTDKEMTATIGGSLVDDLGQAAGVLIGVIGALNPPPTVVVAPPPSDADIAFNIAQSLNAQHNQNAEESLFTALQIYGALYGPR